VLGDRIFVEFVQRLDGYDSYGAVDAPVRMAAHRRARAGCSPASTPASAE
jgi:4-hydroxyphenylpyruvate dioxygenase